MMLTGSRYFGTAGEHSDFDYVAERSEWLMQELEAAGFEKLQENLQSARSLAALYRRGDLHVQLVRDLDAVAAVQAVMTELELGPALENKPWAVVLWRLAHTCYQLGKQAGEQQHGHSNGS